MNLLQRLFGPSTDARDPVRPLYDAVVARARAADWYLDGAPDTVDGRFDMVAAILAVVLVRLESEADARAASAHLAEVFVDDMDGQLRQSGVGDVTVGKYVGRMMAALGGRLTAYRDAGADVERLRDALVRNLWRAADPGDGAMRVAGRLARFVTALGATPANQILAGRLPELER